MKNPGALAVAEQLFRISLGIQKLNKNLERRIGMSLVQWYVLKRLVEMPGVAAGVLASKVGVCPGTLTPLLQRLKQRGMLFLERDEYDFRKKTVLISREGRLRLIEAEKALFRMMDDCANGHSSRFSESEIEELLIRCNGGETLRT